jgi:hypothetical protein
LYDLRRRNKLNHFDWPHGFASYHDVVEVYDPSCKGRAEMTPV